MIEKASSRESTLQSSGSWEEAVYKGKANHSSFFVGGIQFEMVKSGGINEELCKNNKNNEKQQVKTYISVNSYNVSTVNNRSIDLHLTTITTFGKQKIPKVSRPKYFIKRYYVLIIKKGVILCRRKYLKKWNYRWYAGSNLKWSSLVRSTKSYGKSNRAAFRLRGRCCRAENIGQIQPLYRAILHLQCDLSLVKPEFSRLSQVLIGAIK